MEKDLLDSNNCENVGIASSEDMSCLREVTVLSKDAMGERKIHHLIHEHLNDPLDPAQFLDTYSSVLGDGFHKIDRAKVPIHHEFKKSYKVALGDAFFHLE